MYKNPIEMERIAIVMCFLWHRMNDCVFNNKFQSPNQLVQSAMAEFQKYQASLKFNAQNTPQQASVQWMIPETGVVKVKWNAVVSGENQKIGIEIVIMDHRREIFACLSLSKTLLSQSLLAKCWVLRRTLNLCSKLGLQLVHLEGDAHVMINAIFSNKLVEEFKSQLCWKLDWRISFVHKEGNGVVHF